MLQHGPLSSLLTNSGDWKIVIGDRAHKTAATDPVLSVSNLRAPQTPAE
jgi:hypothetical protein